ncbi:40S ribosomal protein S10 [Plecturocebus cupreus]
MKEQFAWRHFFWCLTNEGIQYLHDYLHLPLETVAATLCCSRPEAGRPGPKGLEGERPARLTRGDADSDTYTWSACRPVQTRKPRRGWASNPVPVERQILVVDVVPRDGIRTCSHHRGGEEVALIQEVHVQRIYITTLKDKY